MRKYVVTGLLLVYFIATALSLSFAAVFSVSNVPHLKAGATPVKPENVSAASLAVFGFRPKGDAEAKFYGIAFAQALADRLYCSPSNITQQYTLGDLSEHLQYGGCKPGSPIPDALAAKTAGAMGIRYVVTGDIYISKDVAAINLKLVDLTNPKRLISPLKASGKLSDLPAMQAKAAKWIAAGMKLQIYALHEKALEEPNFANPQALLLYGRACLTEKAEEGIAGRWEAAKADSNSLFTVLRLLECYINAGTYKDIEDEKRLPVLIADAQNRFPGNGHIELLKALLVLRRSEYIAGQKALEEVLKTNPFMCRAHVALATVARARRDGVSAISRGRTLLTLWPRNPVYRAALAAGYAVAANNARHGHFYGDMTPEMEKKWQTNMDACLRESRVTLGYDRNCAQAWWQLLNSSLELSDMSLCDKAFNELVRLNPKDLGVYIERSRCCWSQWGGTQAQRDALIAQVDKAFGKDSYESAFMRFYITAYSADPKKDYDKVLLLADEAVKKCNGRDGRVLYQRCKAANWTRLKDEMTDETLELARQGFEKWHTQDWRFMLAQSYKIHFDATRSQKTDMSLLSEAIKHFAVYGNEVPSDPAVYDMLGSCFSGDPKRALPHFRRALELDPADSWAKQGLKWCETVLGPAKGFSEPK